VDNVLKTMRIAPCLFSLLFMGCTSGVIPPSQMPAAVRLARADVEKAVLERFGGAALARARAADGFVAVLRYPGLPMPDHDTDGHPITPAYPTALLFQEKGRWYAYGMQGLHPMLPRWSERLQSVLRDPRLWNEPVTGGPVGCTDAGASYAWLRVAGHDEQARIGHCGGSPLTEELVSAALMG
jgi:hypothetical protein